MSKVYTVNSGESGADQIPSIEYLNELIKMIEDKLMHPDTEFTGFPSIKANIEELPVGIKEQAIISANEIKTDSEHKFISDGILATMVDKPSKIEVEYSISEAKQEIKEKIEEIYMRIVNTPNVINKLRDIATILNEDKVADGLLNTLAYKVNFEDFKQHNSSSSHMDNNDRKALNILLKCLKDGFSDWNAEEGAFNAIKNKPDSFPADGGNADTISNHGINELINKDDYDIIIGTSAARYSEDSCDIYAEDGNVDLDSILSLAKDLSTVILFKRGTYTLKIIDNYTSIVIFNGVDRRLSCIKTEKFANIHNSVMRHIGIVDSTVYIGNSCEINDVSFKNCKIILKNTTNCDIIGCVFENCEIIPEGTIMNNIIKFNRFIHTNPITYIGGNNIITENI